MTTTKNELSKELFRYCETDEERERLTAVLAHGSNNAAAKAMGMNRRTVDRTINRIVERAYEHGHIIDTAPNILIMDIETAPLLSYLWTLYKPVFGHNMMVSETYVLSWAAKWLGSDEIMSDAICNHPQYAEAEMPFENDKRVCRSMWELLDKADFVVAHNGDKFDIKRLNTRFLVHGMDPPSPYRSIDTLKIAKANFAFDSNRLDFILQLLTGRNKHDSGGFETWRGCMAGDMEAWENLVRYNEQDVLDLEEIYLMLRPWDKRHPSAVTHGPTRTIPVCPICNSENLVTQVGKYWSTGVSKFPLLKCQDCGTHVRDRKSVLTASERASVVVNV